VALSLPAAARHCDAWQWFVVASSVKQKQQRHHQQLTNGSTILNTVYVGTKTRKLPLPVMGMPVCVLGSVRVLAFYLDPLPELY
jgi:hypothetical protein